MGVEARRGQRPFCEVRGCPLMERFTGLVPEDSISGDSAYGPSPPSMFVGSHGYPDVGLGPLMTPGEVDDAGTLDDPNAWTGMELGDVLALRSGLVRGNATVEVTDAQDIHDPTRATEVTQELAMASRPAYTELEFTKEVDVSFTPKLSGAAAPTGPNLSLERAELAENPRVPKQVDRIVADTDARATTGAWELYEGGVDNYHVQRLLAAGLLGHARDRRFVPTRWSITATDDMLSREIVDDVRDCQSVNKTHLYVGELHGNRFHVLLLPGSWSFEMLEAWLVPEDTPGEQPPDRRLHVLADHEGYEGRTTYADDTVGAYYAARLAVAEHLRDLGRQARALVMREITDDYYAPAGVWVVREGVREALDGDARHPGGLEPALKRVREENVLGTPWAEHSTLIDDERHQARITSFLDEE
jgi:hypothetical protein